MCLLRLRARNACHAVDGSAGLSDSEFQCRFINTVPMVANHNDWYASDGIHANATGEQAIADAVWKQMKADCAGQAASSGCCM